MYFLHQDQPSSNDGVSTVPVVVGAVVAVVVISVVVIVILVLVIRYRHDKKSLIISKEQESNSDRQNMLSGFIEEMSRDGTLLPERCINLGSIVGQG